MLFASVSTALPMNRFFSLARLAVLGAMALTALAPAHAAYPDKPIRLIVVYPAGGTTDAVARALREAKIVAVTGRSLGHGWIE